MWNAKKRHMGSWQHRVTSNAEVEEADEGGQVERGEEGRRRREYQGVEEMCNAVKTLRYCMIRNAERRAVEGKRRGHEENRG